MEAGRRTFLPEKIPEYTEPHIHKMPRHGQASGNGEPEVFPHISLRYERLRPVRAAEEYAAEKCNYE